MLQNYLSPSAYQSLLETKAKRLKSRAQYTGLWQPIPDSPQDHAYHSQADIIGFGGAAGGGKSDLILGRAFTQAKRARIFRRLFTDLTDIVDRGNDLTQYEPSFVWGTKRAWEFPDGRKVMLSAVEHEKDLSKYKGRPADLLAFDEADQFPESYYRFLTGWLRTTDTDQQTVIMLCFNPPNEEGEWLIRYFGPWLDDQHSNPAADGELRYFIHDGEKDVEVESAKPVTIGDDTYTPKSRTFFHARVDDNPYLMASGYDKQLESLPEPLRSQLRWGDFTATRKDDIWQVIPTAWILEAQRRWQERERPKLAMRALGVDVARGGEAQTALAPLYMNYFDEITTIPGKETPDGYAVHDVVLQAIGPTDPVIGIDGIGVGGSAYDLLRVHPRIGNQVHSINAGQASGMSDKTGKFGFANVRAEMWWRFREALDPASGENIALPPSRTLRNDLRAPRYKVRSGRYVIEAKEEIRKRIGRSTDEADAVVMAWYIATQETTLSWVSVPDIFGR